VPTLVHDDFVLGESTVICEYIDDAFTAPPLKPADPKERARMRGFTKFIDAAIFPATATVSMSIAFHHQFTPEMYDTMEKARPGWLANFRQLQKGTENPGVSGRYSAARQDDRRYGTSARRPPRSVARGRNLYAG
jgi:glutathione S-transferase